MRLIYPHWEILVLKKTKKDNIMKILKTQHGSVITSFLIICTLMLFLGCNSVGTEDIDEMNNLTSDIATESLKKGPAPVLYNFNQLNGNDTYPFENLNGQDNWTSVGYPSSQNFYVGVTKSLGFDGTQALRFVDIGSGYGASASRLNDSSFSFPALSNNDVVSIQVDFGVGYWGNHFGLGYDKDESGVIDRYQNSETGIELVIGSHPTLGGLKVMNTGSGTVTTVPLENVGGAGWVRVHLVMAISANEGEGAGYVYYQNLTNGDTSLIPVAGLQNVSLGLDPSSDDAKNASLWNGMWLHMEGATNQLDNIEIGSPDKITVCHKPGTIDEETLNVSVRALSAHLAHGDDVGYCGNI